MIGRYKVITHVSCSSAPVLSSISEPCFCRSISSTSRNDCLQIEDTFVIDIIMRQRKEREREEKEDGREGGSYLMSPIQNISRIMSRAFKSCCTS